MRNDSPMKKKNDIFDDDIQLNCYECCHDNCKCKEADCYDLSYFINQPPNKPDHKEKKEYDCINEQSKPNPKKKEDDCCCKNSLRKAFKILLDPCLKSLIDLTSFTLIGQNFVTTEDSTTIKSVSVCKNDAITYSDDTNLTLTTLCDLVGFNFTLNSAPVGCLTTDSEIDNSFIKAISRLSGKKNPDDFCCKEEKGCCCNNTKATYLAKSISPVTIFINSSALSTNPVDNLQVIAIIDEVVWLFDTDNRKVYVVCLNNIVALN